MFALQTQAAQHRSSWVSIYTPCCAQSHISNLYDTLGSTVSLEGWGWGGRGEDYHTSLLIRSQSEQMTKLDSVPTSQSISVLSCSLIT